MQKELWKPILGYENYYSISNYGRVKSHYRIVYDFNGIQLRVNKPRIIRARKGTYLMVGLNRDRKQNHFSIHRLVATHFLDIV